jgi:hypothetical protein
MKRREQEDIPQERDRHLDIPAEANRDKHINFLEAEDTRSSDNAPGSGSPFYIPNNTPLKDRDPQDGNRA